MDTQRVNGLTQVEHDTRRRRRIDPAPRTYFVPGGGPGNRDAKAGFHSPLPVLALGLALRDKAVDR